MADEDRFVRVGRSHPACCVHDGCEWLAVKDGRCPSHPVPGTPRNPAIAGLRQYVLGGTLGERAGVMSNSSGLKTLNEEVAITRAVLELILSKIDDANSATLFTDKIDKSVNTIARLIGDMQKLEERNKELLDRATVFGIGDSILQILVDVVPPETLLVVTEKIYEAITTGIGGTIPK